jgi:hypothetical protein
MRKIINRPLSRSIVCVLIAALLLAPTAALATDDVSLDEVTAGSIAADILIGRPLGILAIGVGSTLFAVALPFAAMGRNIGSITRVLVIEPVKYTFSRPVGDFG